MMAQAYVKQHASEKNKKPSFEYMGDDEEDISAKVTQYIKSTVVKHKGIGALEVKPEIVVSGTIEPSCYEYMLPAILLWNPTLVFPDHIQQFKCSICKTSVSQLPLETHHSVRSLYGRNETVLLVSPKYVCCQGHTYSGYDPRVLQSLPNQDMIPFILFHKSGVTRELYDHINATASNGSKFNEIERNLVEQYWQSYSVREQAFWNSVKLFVEKNPEHSITNFNFEKFDPSKNKHPSNDFITSCFLVHFLENEGLFTECMAKGTAKEWISLDHTFKVASNIGLNNPDGKWATQFSSLMCILNEDGNVLSWKLTKSEAFHHIEEMLQALKSRHIACGINLKGACIDNCCHWRDKLQDVFGDDFTVVLDLFHAVSRITRKIPKRHSLRKECVKDLRLVFRQSSDVGEERKEATPPKEVIKEQMEAFVDKWSEVRNEEGVAVLPRKAVKECTKLTKHIINGCLSEIPPHLSTSRNERLHRDLKKQVPNCKLGVAVAVAALTVAFYRHNSKKLYNGVVPPLLSLKTDFITTATPFEGLDSSESFGLGPLISHVDESGDVQISTSWCRNPLDSDLATAAVQSSTAIRSTMKEVCNQAVEMLFYEEQIQKMFPDSLVLDKTFIPYQATALSVVLSPELANADHTLSSENDECVLQQYHLSYLNQRPPESAALANKYQFSEALGEHIYFHLHQYHDDDYADYLKETLTLDEDFTLSDIKASISKGVDDCGKSDAQLIQSLSDTTGAVFNIVCNSNNISMIPVFPKKRVPFSPMFQFHYSDVGLFLPVLWNGKANISRSTAVNEKETEKEDEEIMSCHCGRSRKSTSSKCVTKPGQKYLSRCSCFTEGRPCTEHCECQGCENPHGSKPPKLARRTIKRQRIHHQAQTILDSGKRGVAFMLESKEIPTLGCWTRMEHYLFEALVAELKSDKTKQTDKEAIKEEFNSICDAVLSDVSNRLAIGTKSTTQVQGKIRVHERAVSAFKELLKLEISRLYSKAYS